MKPERRFACHWATGPLGHWAGTNEPVGRLSSLAIRDRVNRVFRFRESETVRLASLHNPSSRAEHTGFCKARDAASGDDASDF